jgi:membrane dipeptidase
MTWPRRVPVFDGHNDALLRLYRRGGADAPQTFLEGDDKGQLDLPKARQGGFAGGLFAIFVPSTDNATGPRSDTPSSLVGYRHPLWPSVELVAAQKAVFSMVSLLLRIERESQGDVRICRNLNDIRQSMEDGALAAVLHIEGAEAIDPNFELLDVLHETGLRSLGPVWSRSNAFGHGVPFLCPSSPDTGPGLTDLGKQLVRACNRLRILIDLSHLNERGFWDVAAISNAPLVATHSNAHALSPHSRNLTDKQLAAIREAGGIIGVNFATSFLRPDGGRDAAETPTELVVEHVEHILEHVGEDSVGLGSRRCGERGTLVSLTFLAPGAPPVRRRPDEPTFGIDDAAARTPEPGARVYDRATRLPARSLRERGAPLGGPSYALRRPDRGRPASSRSPTGNGGA